MVTAVAVYPVTDWSDSEAAWTALVVHISQGNERAMTELYDRTNRLVYGLALRILGDPVSAEDVTLEVYLQVWRTTSTYDPRRGRVPSWLVTLTRSRAIDALRSRQAQRVIIFTSKGRPCAPAIIAAPTPAPFMERHSPIPDVSSCSWRRRQTNFLSDQDFQSTANLPGAASRT